MNSFTNTILTLLLGWLRTLLNAVRDFISSDSSTAFFDFFRHNWRILFLVLCIVGFSLDIIVYLARWRPRLLSHRRRARRASYAPTLPETYDPQEYDGGPFTDPTYRYAPVPDEPYDELVMEPTAQYQIQSRQNGQAMSAPPYTTPYYAPETASYGEDHPALYTDEPMRETPYAPPADQQRFAFGMAPSFGSAQSEPAYQYHQETAPTFAPPQYGQDFGPVGYPSTPQPNGLPADYGEPAPQQAFERPSPHFRPFSDRGEQNYAPPRNRGFGAVAKKARTLLNVDEAYESMTYKDLQPTVDVSKAFHSPVYPEKKTEGDA